MPVKRTQSTQTIIHSILCGSALMAGVTGCKSAKPIDDTALTTQVQQRLAADAAVSAEPVQVMTQGGVVTLTGSVSSTAARSLVANDVAGVAGVKQVMNDMTVATASDLAAPQITTPTPVEPQQTAINRRTERVQPRPAPITRSTPSVAAPAPAPSPVVPAPAPAASVARVITLPAGSTLPVRITQTLDSETAQPGDTFSGSLATDILQDGMVLIPRGATVSGRVDEVHEAGHFKGASLLTVEVTGVNAHGQRISLATQPYSVEGKGRGKNTAIKTGVGAAAGALLGGIFGGGKGAAIGAAAGGGTGAAINGVTRGEQVQIPSESVIRFVTTNSVAVRTNVRAGDGSGSPYLQNR